LIASADQLRRDLELTIGQTAQPPDAHPLSWLQTVPGIGQLLRRVLWYEMPALARFPRLQAGVSSGRRVQGAKASAGKRDGPAGTQSGNASLPWAFAEAAVLWLRHPPGGQQSLARLEHKDGQGKALPSLAHTRARALSDRLPRRVACDR